MGEALRAMESLHPDVWRASQLAAPGSRTVASGFANLDGELPGGGWPTGSLTELMIPQPGCGELRLLRPALATLAARPLFFLQPPHRLQPAAFDWWGLPTRNLTVLKAAKTADALWATEQVLHAGTAGAVLLWQSQIRPEALRRIQLAAQRSDSLFVLFRPLAAAASTSPSPLRLLMAPLSSGISVSFVKRRGPSRDESLFVPLAPSPILFDRHALDRSPSAPPRPRELSPELVHDIV